MMVTMAGDRADLPGRIREDGLVGNDDLGQLGAPCNRKNTSDPLFADYGTLNTR